MLEQILREIKDYFIRDVWSGNFSIVGGSLQQVDFLREGQYFKIHGSLLNDGVYEYPADDLEDEDFDGEVWSLAIPPQLVSLAEEIDDWNEANDAVLKSPYSSESFGGYSYTKSTSGGGSGSSGSGGVSWKSIFASRLTEWRKIRYEFAIRRHDYLRNTE